MPGPVLHPLTLAARKEFEAAVRTAPAADSLLAAYGFPYHFIWHELFSYEWLELEGHYCLLAANQDGGFFALPPLGPDPCGPALPAALRFLKERNSIAGISRIENVPAELADRCRAQGYRVVAKGADYLYRRVDLAGLRGDRYKSQRADYNHCVKHADPSVRLYRSEDLGPCVDLFRRWQRDIAATDAATFARQLAADAESSHRVALRAASELDLTGLVAEVHGRVEAYTFGYPLTPALSGDVSGASSTFCILLEIANRQIKGLAQYIFREFCRKLTSYDFINAMDDSGLSGLRQAKEQYHPVRLLPSYIVSEA
jgi:uncharacterized protein